MAMTGFFPLLWWSLAGACAVGGSVYLFIEYQAYLLRTSVSSVPGGLRFQSHRFSVESRQGAKQLVVVTKGGHYARQPQPGGDEQVQSGAQTVTLDAVGLRMEVFRILGTVEGEEKPKEMGFSTVYFKTSDELTQKARGRDVSERSELRLDHVPDPIAREFAGFANGLHDWIAKIERQLAADVQEKRQREEDEARATAAANAAPALDDPAAALSDAEREARAATQIALWRQAAGFTGAFSKVSIDPRGQIEWFVDLDPAGQVTLHGGRRTFHGSLKGGRLNAHRTELEVAVRDEFWTPESPQLVAFRILLGSPAQDRLVWIKRLAAAIT
jgi:hypothetical protein